MIDRSDEETGELVKAWIRRYGPAIFLGIIIALGVLGFLDWRKQHQRHVNHQLAHQLETLQNALTDKQQDTIKTAYTPALQNDSGEAGNLAALMMAGYYAELGDSAQAEKMLEKASHAKDVLVQQTATWQRANLQANAKQYDTALATLQNLANSAYSAPAASLKGDIYYAQGKTAEALTAYQEAQKRENNPILTLRISQLKAAQLTTAKE